MKDVIITEETNKFWPAIIIKNILRHINCGKGWEKGSGERISQTALKKRKILKELTIEEFLLEYPEFI